MKTGKNVDTQKQKVGYNHIHDMLTAAKSIATLTEAVEQSIPLIQQYKLDDYQVEKLQDYGYKRYNDIMNNLRDMAYEQQRNKFKK